VTKSDFQDAVTRVLDEHGLDDSDIVVEDFLKDLTVALEYDLGVDFDEEETEDAAPGLQDEE